MSLARWSSDPRSVGRGENRPQAAQGQKHRMLREGRSLEAGLDLSGDDGRFPQWCRALGEPSGQRGQKERIPPRGWALGAGD